MGFISKKVLETPPSATVSIADRVTEMRRQGVSVVDFSAGRTVENTPLISAQIQMEGLGKALSVCGVGDQHYPQAIMRYTGRGVLRLD